MPPKPRPGRGRSLVGTAYWSEKIRPRIIRRDRNTCQMCDRTLLAVDLEVDHIVPRARGGTDDPSNLRTLCKPCHRGLKGRTASETLPRFARSAASEPTAYPVHTCGTAELPTLRGNFTLGVWQGHGCPPGCPGGKR
jgi:hypothetical protein